MAKLTSDQFAEKIKSQYPQYSSVDNATLTQKMIAKYPTYADKVDTGNSSVAGAPPGTSPYEITGPSNDNWFGKYISSPITNAGLGAGKTIANAGFELGKLASKGLGHLVGSADPTVAKYLKETIPENMEKVRSAVYDAPSITERTNTLSGGVGSFIGDAALIAAPGNAVAKAQEFVAGPAVAARAIVSKTPVIGKVAGYTLEKVLQALPEAAQGFVYGKVKGETNKEALGTAAIFGAGSATLHAGADAVRSFGGNLSDDIGRAIGMTGKMSARLAQERIPQATRALGLINRLAPDIKVVDRDGVEASFNPAKATFGETVQAWTKARDYIYRAYTDLANRAGDAGSMFHQQDWHDVIGALRTASKDSTSAFKNKADSLIRDIEDNFGTRLKDGTVEFSPVPLERMQNFIEKVNTDVNILSDKAAAEMSAVASKKMREILDNKIMSNTTGGYQQLRNAYGDLKSIETDLVNQYKKAARKVGGAIPAYIEGFGAIDLIAAGITGNVGHAAMGAGKIALGEIMKNLRDPEKALRRAFQQMGPVKARGPVGARALGPKPENTPNQSVEDIINVLRNPATRPAASLDRRLPAGGPQAIPMGPRTFPKSGAKVTGDYEDFLRQQGLERSPEDMLALPPGTTKGPGGPTIPLPARSQSTIDASERARLRPPVRYRKPSKPRTK